MRSSGGASGACVHAAVALPATAGSYPSTLAACAELADDLFPNLGIRRYSIKRMRLEVQTRDLLGLVVAVETIAVDDGRLPLAFIADQAAAGCECAGQRSSCE
jgi:hypothetical protein